MLYKGQGNFNEFPNVNSDVTMGDVYTFNPASSVVQDPFYKGLTFLKAMMPTIVSAVKTGARYKSHSLQVEATSFLEKEGTGKETKRKILEHQMAAKRWAILGGDIQGAIDLKKQILSTQDSINGVTREKKENDVSAFEHLDSQDRYLAEAVSQEVSGIGDQIDMQEAVDYALADIYPENQKERATTIFEAREESKTLIKNLRENEKLESKLTS